MNFKRGKESLALAAFPVQWLTAGYFYTSNILSCCRSLDHLVYYRKVIKEGNKEYKSPFSYYEIGMAVLQPAIVAANPAYIGTPTFWVMTVPWIASVITCTSMYFKGGRASDEIEDDFAVLEVIDDEEIEQSKKMEIEFPDFVVVDKSDLMMVCLRIILVCCFLLTAASSADTIAETGTNTCPSGTYSCDKICIPSSWICDGQEDCSDGSDEKFCGSIFEGRIAQLIGARMTEKNIPFVCPNRVQIPNAWVCDGQEDCPDGSDEKKCGQAKEIEREKKVNETVALPLTTSSTFTVATTVIPPEALHTTANTACSPNPCAHGCTDSVDGFKCTCPEGTILQSDGKTCADEAIHFSITGEIKLTPVSSSSNGHNLLARALGIKLNEVPIEFVNPTTTSNDITSSDEACMLPKLTFTDTLAFATFPLQLLSCGYPYTRNNSFALFFLAAIVVHIAYYQRVIKEGRNEYRMHFFYYEVVVATVQVFFVATNPVSIETAPFWLMVIPFIGQVITCITMYFFGRPFDYGADYSHYSRVEIVRDFLPFPTVHRKDLI